MILTEPIKDRSKAILVRISCPNRKQVKFSVLPDDKVSYVLNCFENYYHLFERGGYVLRHSANKQLLDESLSLQEANIRHGDLLRIGNTKERWTIQNAMNGREVTVALPFPLTFFLPEVLSAAVADPWLQLQQEKERYLVKYAGFRVANQSLAFMNGINFLFTTLPNRVIEPMWERVDPISYSPMVADQLGPEEQWPTEPFVEEALQAHQAERNALDVVSRTEFRFHVLPNRKINLFLQDGWPVELVAKIQQVQQLIRGKAKRSGGFRNCERCGYLCELWGVCPQCKADYSQWTETEEAFLERQSQAMRQVMKEKAAYTPLTIEKSFPLSATGVDMVYAANIAFCHSYNLHQNELRFHRRIRGYGHYYEVRCVETTLCLNDRTDLFDAKVREGYTIVVDRRWDLMQD